MRNPKDNMGFRSVISHATQFPRTPYYISLSVINNMKRTPQQNYIESNYTYP